MCIILRSNERYTHSDLIEKKKCQNYETSWNIQKEQIKKTPTCQKKAFKCKLVWRYKHHYALNLITP